MTTRVTTRRARDDRGAGLILVIGISGVVFGLVATGLVVAVNAMQQSRQRSNFEMALVSAEAGIDRTLAQLQEAYDNGTGEAGDFPVPGTQYAQCPYTAVPGPSGADVESEAAEEAWARTQLNNLRQSHPDCIETSESGQYLVLKPKSQATGPYKGYGRVYAMGWSPGIGQSEVSERLVKTEYIFMPFSPSHAILTGGDLKLESSTLVTTAQGFATNLAAVHSNGTITNVGNPTVYGKVTSTGTSTATSNRFYANPSGAVQQSANVAVPKVNALAFYRQAPNMDSLSVVAFGYWHDLCPDGTVRQYSMNSAPCSNENQYAGLTGVTYDDDSHTWTISRDAPIGVYYAHEANVTSGNGNDSFSNLTVIASSENPTDCATKKYGNVFWDHYELKAPAVTNLFLYADADLVTTSNFTAGNNGQNGSAVQSGMFVAGDQMDMATSSQGAVGAVIAADQCGTPGDGSPTTANVVKNPEVYYDPKAKSPFSSIVNQTLWLEY